MTTRNRTTADDAVYRKDGWIVIPGILTDGSKVYSVIDTSDYKDPINAVDLNAAIRIADCLAADAI